MDYYLGSLLVQHSDYKHAPCHLTDLVLSLSSDISWEYDILLVNIFNSQLLYL